MFCRIETRRQSNPRLNAECSSMNVVRYTGDCFAACARSDLYTFIMNNKEIKRQKIILFDGVCNLCNGSVIFILRREKHPVLQFASIQSESGRELLEWCGLPPDYTQAVIYIENGRVHLASTAALRAVSESARVLPAARAATAGATAWRASRMLWPTRGSSRSTACCNWTPGN